MALSAHQLTLWRRWTLYCAAGELLGIGSAGAIAFAVNHLVGEPTTLPAKLLVLGAMLLAGAIEGFLLASFQWRVLHQQLPGVPLAGWRAYTMAIAVLGWLLGMMPSLFLFDEPAAEGQAAAAPPAILDNTWFVMGASAVMGLVVGALFGGFQWMVLRRHVHRAGRWIWVNALGWGLGLPFIYLGASIPTADSSIAVNIAMGVLGGLLAGLSVGAVTGRALVEMREG